MLNGKVVVVTGGAGLLGRAFCLEIVNNGGVAIVADIQVADAEALSAELNALVPGSSSAVCIDITDEKSVRSVISAVVERFGRVDAVVNNAYPRNKNWGARLSETTYDNFCENISMHLGGYFQVMKLFSEHFALNGGGKVINMASIYGVMMPRNSIYAGTQMSMSVEYAAIKSSILHLTKFFAHHFRGQCVTVNCISPGGILDRQPESFLRNYREHCNSKGMLDPADVTGTLCYLLSSAADCVTGQNIIVDDGFSL